MKRIWPLLFLTLSLAAGELDFLPDPVATVDNVPISRNAVLERLHREKAISPDMKEPELLLRARRAVESEIYFFLLARFLGREGITPSESAAAAQLEMLEKLLPRGIPGRTQEELAALAASETYRYNVALQSFLLKNAPELLKVEDAEVERLYRLNRETFRVPEEYEFGVIRIRKDRPGAADLAETVRARLLQGEDFDRVARETDPAGAEMPDAEVIELLRKGNPALPVNSISGILENTEGYFIIKVKAKHPARYIALVEIAPYLRLQLVSEKAGRAFELILRRELANAKVEHFIK